MGKNIMQGEKPDGIKKKEGRMRKKLKLNFNESKEKENDAPLRYSHRHLKTAGISIKIVPYKNGKRSFIFYGESF